MDRGRSNAVSGGQFYFEDFVETQYRVDEFWSGSSNPGQRINSATEPIICPAGQQYLARYPHQPCNDGAVKPFDNISYAFNSRLFSETIVFNGKQRFNPDTKVSSRILECPNIPIAFDGDGEEAGKMRRKPYFSAPPVNGHDDLYSDGTWWFPSYRHGGETNVAFTGGHVLGSKNPTRERDWNWAYQPMPLR